MTKRLIALAGVLCLIAAPLTAADKPSDADLQTYVDGTYKVLLRCPAEWKPTPGYDVTPALGPEHRPRAFVLDAEGGPGNTAQQLCKGAAEHVLQPFGTKPTIRPLKADGQSACLVWPSADQGMISPEAEVIVKYPQPVEIGGYLYSFMTLHAETKYIMPLIRSIKFLAPDPQNAPFLMEIAFEGDESSSKAFKTGSPITVTITLDNNSERELRGPFSDPVTYYHFIVLMLGGRGIPFTGKYW